MSSAERTGKRSLLYSAWHRSRSIARFIGSRRAWALTYIDIDCCEYCPWCRQPLALIETARGETAPKEARVSTVLGQMAGVPVYSVAYIAGAGAVCDGEDIEWFRWRQLWPSRLPEQHGTPAEYAAWLYELRIEHASSCDAEPLIEPFERERLL
jgi:hypothetical protein